MRHISLDLIRVTEAAAIAASQWIGSGNKLEADKAATDAMRHRLNGMQFCGKIAICEGIKDSSYCLAHSEIVGATEHAEPQYDLAVDPLEGTSPTVTSGPEAISTIGIAHKDCMFTSDHFYMQKLAYGPRIKAVTNLSVDDPIEVTIDKISRATRRPASGIMVCMLNRPRHHEIIDRLRAMGVRLKLIQDCDVSGAVATCLPESGVDLLYGIGGAPEAILSACAIKCMGGDFQAKEVVAATDKAIWEPVSRVLEMEDLVKGPCIFVATGVTNGSILRGVRNSTRGTVTHSVFMRSESGTIRWLKAEHGN